jgi:hypothetical protein
MLGLLAICVDLVNVRVVGKIQSCRRRCIPHFSIPHVDDESMLTLKISAQNAFPAGAL